MPRYAEMAPFTPLFLRGQNQIGKLWLLYCKLGSAAAAAPAAVYISASNKVFKWLFRQLNSSSPLSLLVSPGSRSPPDLPGTLHPPNPTSFRGRGARARLSGRDAFQISLKKDIPSSALKPLHRQQHEHSPKGDPKAPSEKLKCKCVTELGSPSPSPSFLYEELNECDARTTYPCMILRAMEGKKGG